EVLKDSLLVPLCLLFITGRLAFPTVSVLAICCNGSHIRRACECTCQRKRSLVCKVIQNAPVAGVSRDSSVIISLVEIETGLLTVQQIDFELYSFDFDRCLRWSSA